jgi:hypothetical protein
LKWRVVLLLAGAFALAVLSRGMVRWAAAAVTAAAAVYAVHRYRQWNGRGWRRVHHRAMLAYEGIAGSERAAARHAGRQFDLGLVCTELGLLLCGEDNRAVVDAMVSDLAVKQGTFLSGLVERHLTEVLPGAPFELRRDLTASLRALPFGPQLLIAFVIENTYGGAEAARYAVALVSGDAE